MGEGTMRVEVMEMIFGLTGVKQWYEFGEESLLKGYEDERILDFLHPIRRQLEEVSPSLKPSRQFALVAFQAMRKQIAPFQVGLEIIADAYDQNPSVIYEAVAKTAAKITGARFAFVGLLEREANKTRIVLKGFEGINTSDKDALQKLDLEFDDSGKTKGITGYVAKSKMPILEGNLKDDYNKLEREKKIQFLDPNNIGVQSELCVPILVKDNVVGVIDVEDQSRKRFDQVDQWILEWLAKVVAIAYSGEQLESFLRDWEAVALGKIEGPPIILKSLMNWTQADYGFVALVNPESRCYVQAIEDRGLVSTIRKQFEEGTLEVVPGIGLCGLALKSGLAQYVEDVADSCGAKGYLPWWKGTVSEIVLPIISIGGKVIGIINLEYKRPRSFKNIDKRLFENIANLVGIVYVVRQSGHLIAKS
jgi:putative methionine-R-sulfoxide reductase with GAF domain